MFVAMLTYFHLYSWHWVEKFNGFLLMHGILLNYVSLRLQICVFGGGVKIHVFLLDKMNKVKTRP